MGKISNRYIGVIIIFAACVVLQGRAGYSDYEKGKDKDLLKNFPLEVDGWVGERRSLEEKIYRILETNSVLVNVYHRGKETVTLSIVYYSDEKVDFHSPEGCSVGKGDRVEKGKQSVVLDVGAKIPVSVNTLTVYRPSHLGKKDRVYYFNKAGDFMGGDYLTFRYKMALNYIHTRKTSGALIILTIPVVDSIDSCDMTCKSFMESFYSKWMEYL